jgi:hypothetical protein
MAKTDAKMRMKKSVEKEFPSFVDEVVGMDISSLEAKILTYAKERENVRDSKANDEGLVKVLDMKAELEAPYRDAMKAIDLKSRYLIELLKEKGGVV